MRRESSAKFLRAHSLTARMLGSPSAEQRPLDTSTDEEMESSKKLVFCVNMYRSVSESIAARQRLRMSVHVPSR